jgi:hypothetical protein
MTDQTGKKTPLVIDSITPETAATNRTALYAWLGMLQDVLAANEGSMLVTRKDENFLWRQTGILIENGVVFAKLGENHYQPIGKDDGTGFYPTTASRLFWAQDFKLAKMTDFEGAFRVEKLISGVQSGAAADATVDLTEYERAKMVDNFEALSDYIKRFNAARDIGEMGPFQQAQTDLLNVLKLACIQCPKLDMRLVRFGMENPELKLQPDLSGDFKIEDLAGVACEWLRMQLNEDATRKHYRTTVLVPTVTVTAEELLLNFNAKLQFLAANKTAEPELIRTVLKEAMTMIPALQPVLEPFDQSTNVFGALKAAANYTATLVPAGEAKPAAEPIQPPATT